VNSLLLDLSVLFTDKPDKWMSSAMQVRIMCGKRVSELVYIFAALGLYVLCLHVLRTDIVSSCDCMCLCLLLFVYVWSLIEKY